MKIVVGTDFNELATAALRLASRIAARHGAELIVVYADRFEPPAEFTAAQVQDIARSIARSKSRTREQLEQYVARHVPAGLTWKAIVAEGFPATAIAEIASAERADFIVIGTHGRGGLQRLIMGSVAEALIHEATVPVLTVRSPEIPADVTRMLCVDSTACEVTQRIASALGATLKLDHEVLPGFDVVVVGADHKLQHDLTRHAPIPVLTITRAAVPAR